MPPPQLTPAQLALQAERKALKQAKKAAAQAANGGAAPSASATEQDDRSRFLKREWVKRGAADADAGGGRPTRIVTWNILAQTLVRRELFPGSDCLRWSDRKAMLLAELAHHSVADVICLQECDRLSDLEKALPTHKPVETKGRGKLHGLVVFYRKDRYTFRATHTVHLDEERLSESEGRGGTRQTKNVGLIVGLEEANGRGVIVTTTHLFWHPKYAYERVRQVIVLIRAIRRFQREHEIEHWPVILAGDLNTQPSEATYQLLVSPETPLDPKAAEEVKLSRRVHTSVDTVNQSLPQSSEGGTGSNTPATEGKDDEGGDEGEGEGEDELPDHDERSIANTRSPKEGDGILELDDLVEMMNEVLPGGATSTLGCIKHEEGAECFGSRGGLEGMHGRGRDEPAYTCYTPLFKLTLDYIFLLPSLGGQPQEVPVDIVEHLRLPLSSELGEGLPRKGVCASDHLAMGCGLWL